LRMSFSELEKMSAPRDGRTWVNVVPFSDQPFYNILLHRTDSDFDATKGFWDAVRRADAPKVFVGPARLKPAADMLKAEFLGIPLENAFGQYEGIREQLKWKCKPGTIFVFAAGMISKALTASLLMRSPNISCIDAGSAFDPLFIGNTRTKQLPMDFLRLEYREWLDD